MTPVIPPAKENRRKVSKPALFSSIRHRQGSTLATSTSLTMVIVKTWVGTGSLENWKKKQDGEEEKMRNLT